jgi:hypothetical protein
MFNVWLLQFIYGLYIVVTDYRLYMVVTGCIWFMCGCYALDLVYMLFLQLICGLYMVVTA